MMTDQNQRTGVSRKRPGGELDKGGSSVCGGGGGGGQSSVSAARSDNSKRIRPGTPPLSVCTASVHRPP